MSENLEARIAEHYRRGDLEQVILDALVASGRDAARLTPADLAPVDEFHIGGREATAELAARLELAPGLAVLDVGCGLGGTSRYLAAEHGSRVVGIDLTGDYVRAAASLAHRVGLADRVSYCCGSALALPFAPARFDRAVLLHVGMNIPDKDALFAELRRVLRPGGLLGLFEVMRAGSAEPAYPLPWANTAATSFIAEAATYRRALEGAGFELVAERNRRDFALDGFRRLRNRAAAGSPPALGLHLLMGATGREKVANLAAAIERGTVVPVEMVARAR
jgi:ubiquinone/menaquinone biosynthesis C-methylase UbiE